MTLVQLTEKAREDAVACANQVHSGTGWRKAPAQSLVVHSLIKGRSHNEIMAILGAWNEAYQRRIYHLNAADAAEIVTD